MSTTPTNFSLSILNDLALIVYPERWVSHEFSAFVDWMVQRRSEADWREPTSVLVLCLEQLPSIKERHELSSRMPIRPNSPPMRQAMITRRSFGRGFITAVGWLLSNKNYELAAYAPAKYREALTWLAKTAHFDTERAVSELIKAMMATGQRPSELLGDDAASAAS